MVKTYYRRIAMILAAVSMITLSVQPSPVYAEGAYPSNIVTLSVRSSQNSVFASRLAIDSAEITQALIKAKEDNVTNAPSSIKTDIYVTLLQDNQDKLFRMEQTGDIWDETTMKRLILPRKISNKLLSYAEMLRNSHYGKLLSWQDASPLVPLKSIFSITDLETGLTFQVQRRAGKDHADVQPLTKEDTAIMKQIYHKSWSWKRTAILVHTDHEWLAASMNGMPHGGDGIPNNDFSGHFCVHFLNSSTHKSPDPDLAHQLMVHKAAGNLNSFFEAASPLIIAKSFVEAMNQQDLGLLRQASKGISEEKLKFFLQEMNALLSIQPEKHQRLENAKQPEDSSQNESLSVEVQLKVMIYKIGASKQKNTYKFTFKRDSSHSPWRIEDVVTNTKTDIRRT